MKNGTPMIVAALVAGVSSSGVFAATASAGVVDYSWSASHSSAQLGDTVTMTLNASIDHQQPTYFGLAASILDILVADIPGGGSINNAGAGLGVHPSFAAMGNNGQIGLIGIAQVEATQLPMMFNPGINTDTEIELYRFEYTIVDAEARQIAFDVSVFNNTIYSEMGGGGIQLGSSSTPYVLSVTAIPAPGALALLGLGGLVGFSRRRKSAR